MRKFILATIIVLSFIGSAHAQVTVQAGFQTFITHCPENDCHQPRSYGHMQAVRYLSDVGLIALNAIHVIYPEARAKGEAILEIIDNCHLQSSDALTGAYCVDQSARAYLPIYSAEDNTTLYTLSDKEFKAIYGNRYPR